MLQVACEFGFALRWFGLVLWLWGAFWCLLWELSCFGFDLRFCDPVWFSLGFVGVFFTLPVICCFDSVGFVVGVAVSSFV